MKCEICGGLDGPHMLVSCVHALAERVAKLEARQTRDWTEQPDGMPVDDAKLEAAQNLAAAVLKSGPRESDSRPPEDESGRTAAAVISPDIPDGFALAPGWRLVDGSVPEPEKWICTGGAEDDPSWCNRKALYRMNGRGACERHALEMRALVPLVPAEPSGTPCSECGHVPSHSFACSRSAAAKAMAARRAQPEAPAGFTRATVATWLRHKSDQREDDFSGYAAEYVSGVGYGLRMAARLIEAGVPMEPLPAEPPSDAGRPCFAESMNLRCDVHSPAPSEPAKAPLSERMKDWTEGDIPGPGIQGALTVFVREAADLEARLAFVTSGLESATNGERLERLRVDDLTARLAATEKAHAETKAKLVLCVESRTCAECGGPTAISDLQCSNCYDRDITAAEQAAVARVAEERERCLVHFDRLGRETKFRDDVREAIASGAPAPKVTP